MFVNQGDFDDMRKILEKCPSCNSELVIAQLDCPACQTSVVGRFKPTIFSRLSPDNLRFLEIFVKNRGNVKEMERELGVSYWSIRNQLNEVIAELGFEPAGTSDEQPAPAGANTRLAVLRRLDKGEITTEEATKLLSKL